MAGAQPLSFEMKSDYVLRTSQINGLHSYAIAHYAYDNLRYKKFVVMAEDYAAGHDYADIFIGIIKEKGGEIVQEIYTPYGATDYAPYITQIKNADAVWGFYNVRDAVNFVNQYAEFGVWKRMPLIGVSGLVTPATLSAQRDNVVGIVMAGHSAPFGAWPDKPDYQKFDQTFLKKFNEPAGDIAVNAYTGMQVIYKAAEAVKGDVENALAFLDAAKKVQFEGLYSPIKFESGTNNVTVDVRVLKIEKKDGKIGFTILETYKDLGPSKIAKYRKQ
jgi:branched-chain amino acid transport system substrate-binding protein